MCQTDYTVCRQGYYEYDAGKIAIARSRETGVFTVLWSQTPMEHNGVGLGWGIAIHESSDQSSGQAPYSPFDRKLRFGRRQTRSRTHHRKPRTADEGVSVETSSSRFSFFSALRADLLQKRP
jgi:hypothetical protein